MASLLLGTSSMASQVLSLSLSKSHSISSLSSLSLSSSPSFSLSSTVSTSPAFPLIYCGRGDRKTAKGKRFNHSFGNARPRNNKKGRGPPKAPIPSTAPKQDPLATVEPVKIEVDDE
ncbi:hypothetical protein RND81_08G211900 [Saponaria officinalis]|uniref:30S ribosomal protein S31, chloroplastic n=1 Tax=Saponaria officinalis TaxID=3572 RepID=A0AAW1J997_SAPOF